MLFVCVDMIIHYFSNKSLYLYFFVSYGWKQSIYTSIEKIVCCVFLRLVYSMLPVSLDCLRLVYTMLPVSLDCLRLVYSMLPVSLDCLRLVYSMLPVSLDCLRLVYSMLPVSLDCPFLITPSVFSNVYICSSTFCIHHDKTPG
jgi:hypothetical protein